ncbi:uncharacterized protein EV154DRAFT_518175 [Mucor mucedo]|uniref:uncharacterized protein n=1 Tax=Mucor mucedo TaxID=29922 RepID=UPI00221F27B9|nr:uncharacterized protein EV154DRAFT_518175 [Mucor mucedo]KAI7888278.1 hypothetical protein EV154DRAFT_518175 [Mucor mucedo]
MPLSKSDKKVLELLTIQANDEREVKMQLNTNQLRRIKKHLEEKNNKKRSSISQSRRQTSRVKLTAKDSITIAGLRGTLGSNLLRIGDEIPISSTRSKCFSYFCKNGIVDISDNSKQNLQLCLLGSYVENFLKSTKYKHTTDCANDPNIRCLEKSFKNVRNKNTVMSAYMSVENYQCQNNEERKVKKIYSHILNQHAFRHHMFDPSLLVTYSEQSYIVKFWGYLFEEYFGIRSDIYLQWGDTTSKSCKEAGLGFRLDLRIIAFTSSQNVDVLNGEVAKMTAANEDKYYYDKRKAVLAAKNHLNHLVVNTKYLLPKDIHTIYMPIVQIMGMSCHLYVLSLIDKGLYLLQRVYTMSYPQSNHEIRTGAIQKIIRGFALIEDILQNALDIYDEYSKDTQDIILKKIIKKKGCQKVDINDWISLVIEPEDYEEDRGNNEDEDEAEEAEEDEVEEDEAEDDEASSESQI